MNKIYQLTANDIMKQSPNNIVTDMDGEKVMLCVENGKYYNLGEIGGRIWDLLHPSASLDDIMNTLTSEYSVDITLCEQQVVPFLNRLIQEGLILLSEESSEQS